MKTLKPALLVVFLWLLVYAQAADKFIFRMYPASSFMELVHSGESQSFRYGDRLFLVGYSSTPADFLSAAAKLGAVPGGLAGGGYFYFSLPVEQAPQALPVLGEGRVGYLLPSGKIAPFLTADNETSERFRHGQAYPIRVYFSKGMPVPLLQQGIRARGFFPERVEEDFGYFVVRAHLQDAEKLAALPFVRYIALDTREAVPLMNTALTLNRANKVHAAAPNGLGFTGRGVNVAVIDGGYVGPHIDFERRVVHVERLNLGATNSQHGTHVTGTVAGAGHRNEAFRGMAPKARVYGWNYADDMINKMRQGITQYQTMVSNNSYYFGEYGIFCGFSGSYVPESQDMDELTVLYPSYVPVVASGNSGNLCAGGWGTLPMGIQGSKNNLVVGRCDDNSVVDVGSSRGPTVDGRLKPELVAEGLAVISTYPLQLYGTFSGTSMSAPQVTGAVALIYEAYKAIHGVLPPAMLTRALLCNSAYDLGLPGPDFTHGYGRMDVLKAILAVQDGRFFTGNVIQGDSVTFSLNVPAGTAMSKVMLSWTDPPATLPYNSILVNDLDLYVRTPGGSLLLPLVADAQNPGLAAILARDSLNNMEQVVIATPIVGTYTIVVKGKQVSTPSQDFAVVFQNDPIGIDITYPDGGESLLPGSNAIRWDANGISGNVTIEYSTDNGGSWNPVASGIPAAQSFYFWTTPSVATNQALVRVTNGSETGISSNPFTIMPNMTGLTASVCDRGARLTWTANALAADYVVYQFTFGDTTWKQIGTTAGTEFWVHGLKPGAVYFHSVASRNGAILSRKAEGVSVNMNVVTICPVANDAGVYHLVTPLGGRRFTSSALGSSEQLTCLLKNYGNNSISNFNVSYSVNGGAPVTELYTGTLTPGDTAFFTFSATHNFSATGDYQVKLWTSLPGDLLPGNDTLAFTIRHLPNDPAILPFTEDFDNLPGYDAYTFRMVGLPGLDPFDLQSDSLRARARVGVLDLYANSAPNGITLDHVSGGAASAQLDANLILTLNLSNYTDSVLFLDFAYASHNEPAGNDWVRVRGSDTDPWITVFDLFNNRFPAGFFQEVKRINLSGFLFTNGQNFSSSTQIAFAVQTNRSANQYINQGGYSFDDIRVYNAGRDIAVSVDPVPVSLCSGAYSLQVSIENNSPQPAANIPVFYSVNGGPPVSEVFAGPLPGWSGTFYTFSTPVLNGASPPGKYSVRAWSAFPGDLLAANDTSGVKDILLLPQIGIIPEADDLYREDFEDSDGGWIGTGRLNSWAWGDVQKYLMTQAGMGSKAWANTLSRDYNNNEDSYLYSPCLPTPTPNTSLSFLSQLQIEPTFDSLYLDYSYDGISWNKLGRKGDGYNWYNATNNNNYWDNNISPWQVLSLYDIPQDPSSRPLRLRFRLMADQFVSFEGLGFDQVFYDNLTGFPPTATANGTVATNNQNYTAAQVAGDRVLAEVKALGGTPQVKVSAIISPNMAPTRFRESFILNTRWVVETVSGNFSQLKVRLFFADSLFKRQLNADAATSLLRDLRLVRYNDISIDDDLDNNHFSNGSTTYQPGEFEIWPFKNGYFVEFDTDRPGEFWLQSATPNPAAYNTTRFNTFEAAREEDKASLTWQTFQEINNSKFYLEYSHDGVAFTRFDSVPGEGRLENGTRDYAYIDSITPKPNGLMYYRLSQVDSSGKLYYAGVDTVDFTNVSIPEQMFSAAWQMDGLWLNVFKPLDGKAGVSIYNISGALLDHYTIALQKGLNYLGRGNLDRWPPGAYVVRLNIGKWQGGSRFIKTE